MARKLTTIDKFRAEFTCCWLCQRTAYEAPLGVLDVHHMLRGALKQKYLQDRRGLIRACIDCHSGALAAMDLPAQLWVKRYWDPEWYDRDFVWYAKHPKGKLLTERDVDKAWRDWERRHR